MIINTKINIDSDLISIKKRIKLFIRYIAAIFRAVINYDIKSHSLLGCFKAHVSQVLLFRSKNQS